MARVEVNPDWRGPAEAAWVNFAESRLGPDIADDARLHCPVDTGALKASIRDDMEGLDLIVSATGGGEDEDGNLFISIRNGKVSERFGTHNYGADMEHRIGIGQTRKVHHVNEAGHAYAYFVEMGHEVYHPSTKTVGPNRAEPRPFLRPALFKRRGE